MVSVQSDTRRTRLIHDVGADVTFSESLWKDQGYTKHCQETFLEGAVLHLPASH